MPILSENVKSIEANYIKNTNYRYCDQPESVYCGDKDLQTEVCVQCNPSDGEICGVYNAIL